VATLAVAIGERLGLPEGRLRQLALGDRLHDVGKLSVPNEILNKPGRLTDEEFDEIRRHPGAGAARARPRSGPMPAQPGVRRSGRVARRADRLARRPPTRRKRW
jgi:HD-GYP domain-containing protein (c-di-GMP phosphodiesterase class II)